MTHQKPLEPVDGRVPMSLWLVVRHKSPGAGVCAIYSTKADADEDIDLRTGRGTRPELEGRYGIEPWVVGVDWIPEADRLVSLIHYAIYAEPLDQQKMSDAVWVAHDYLRGLPLRQVTLSGVGSGSDG